MARERKRMVVEEETLEALDLRPPAARALLVPVYLVGAFWPWWLTLLALTFLLWQTLLPFALLGWACAAFALLAGLGYVAKRAIEWRLGTRA